MKKNTLLCELSLEVIRHFKYSCSNTFHIFLCSWVSEELSGSFSTIFQHIDGQQWHNKRENARKNSMATVVLQMPLASVKY